MLLTKNRDAVRTSRARRSCSKRREADAALASRESICRLSVRTATVLEAALVREVVSERMPRAEDVSVASSSLLPLRLLLSLRGEEEEEEEEEEEVAVVVRFGRVDEALVEEENAVDDDDDGDDDDDEEEEAADG